MPRDKSRYRSSSRRRGSSASSESSYGRHKSSKNKRRRRSRSRDSDSPRRRRRSQSTSHDKHSSKSRRSSPSRARSKKSKRLSRSSSREKYRHKSSRKKSSRRRSYSPQSSSRSSSSSSGQSPPPKPIRKINLNDTDSKIEKAIKAAEAAGLTLTKIPQYEYKEVKIKDEMPTMHDRNLLEEINNDSFVAKPFVSSKSKKFSENIVIDLNTQTVKIPESTEIKEEETVLKLDELPTDEELKEMWIRKLYTSRKKLLGELN